MKRIAEDLYLIDSYPRYAFNAYVMGDVLVDAGTRHSVSRIRRQLRGHRITAHVITHAHPDHQGSSHSLCTELDIPLLCGDADADAMERGTFGELLPVNLTTRLQLQFWAGPAHPVARRLREGDVVGGFTVLETPGHSPGHLAFWRESDRVLLAGDVLFNRHPFTGCTGLHEAPTGFTVDTAHNRAAIQRLAELDPAIVCFGHGPPLICQGGKLTNFAARLPESAPTQKG